MPTPNDGSQLWLSYTPLPPATAARISPLFQSLHIPGSSPTLDVIRTELQTALNSLLSANLPLSTNLPTTPNSLLLTTSPDKSLDLTSDLANLGSEGFLLRPVTLNSLPTTLLTANTDAGLLYGSFHLLRLLQTNHPLTNLSLSEQPRLQLRLLNHWDNLDGSIERGYAGKSLWNWSDLPEKLSPRYTTYARACASLGLNGTVLNNVNANPKIFSPEYLRKVAALANVFRPYHLRTYLSVNFASPRLIGGLDSNDPLNPAVIDWWKRKADEIYSLIPDFGGFLVKANSEGQPGPQDYGRTHADGANVLADALSPHRGIVMYRAFVYDDHVDPDRAKRAFKEFTALDGQFRRNVILQVKNGPLDFMPREPFHPLFGVLKHTPVMAELQATQEYLGQSKHLVYLGTLWKEFLDSDTHRDGPDTTVAQVLQHPTQSKTVSDTFSDMLTGICAVSNTGSDENWCGHPFSQSNLYAFGRLAWDPTLPAEHLAEEWILQTLTRHERALDTIKQMMLTSRETFVDYTMPLGLHHLIGGDHYAPQPENANAPRPDWTATYYHQASKNGVGFNRTKTGSNAASEYHPPLNELFNDPTTCPLNLLLWFHHLPWTHPLPTGRTLWQQLCHHYQSGATEAASLAQTWSTLQPDIPPALFAETTKRLEIQVAHSAQWRDHCLKYFQQFSQLPIP